MGEDDAGIELRSPAFTEGSFIPPRFSRDGEDVSPPLEWSDVPAGTVELAIVCDDPDAPGGTFLHWMLTGVDPSTRGLAEGEVPPGSRSWPNDYGGTGYGGPQPPVGHGPHRYFFRVHALSSTLELAPDAAGDDVRAAIDEARLATGTLMGRYER